MPLGIDRKRKIARYELRVANETRVPLAAYAYAVRRQPNVPPVTCLALAIRANSAVQLGFEVGLLARETFERITVELRGDDVHLTVDALPPPAIPEFPRRAAAIGGGVLLAAALGTFLSSRPQIVGLSLPNVALAGSRVDAVYAARGVGSLRYEFDTTDGKVLATGPLAAHDGTVPIVLAANVAQTYLVRLTMQGPLGRDVRVAAIDGERRPIARTVTRVEHPARIASLAVEHDRVVGGSPIVVYYDIDADRGSVRLVDRNAVVWGEQPIKRGAGSVRLNAPVFQEQRELGVSLRAASGPSRAESSVGVLVLTRETPSPSPSPSPSASPSAAVQVPGTDAVPIFPAKAEAPFVLPAQPIRGGGTLEIPIVHPQSGLTVALVAPDGRELASQVVGDRRSVVLSIPRVSSLQRYTVVGRFSLGAGEETFVRDLRVRP